VKVFLGLSNLVENEKNGSCDLVVLEMRTLDPVSSETKACLLKPGGSGDPEGEGLMQNH